MSAIFVLFIGAVTAGAPRGRVEYKGDTLHYLWEEKIIWLRGNAEVKTPEVMAKADSIKYDAKTGIVTASGKPILWVGDQRIDGEKMIYDLNTSEGVVQNGRTEIQKGWFDGRIMRRVGPEELNINYGKFTTCQNNPPHYCFLGSELKVYVDDMVYTRPLVLLVQDIPLFIAPFWWFPIKKGRQSGLLHPKIGRASDKGRYVENFAYYWVINNWSDATFTLDYYETRGPRLNLEGRWVVSPTGSGNINSSYIVEQNQRKRGALDFTHTQKFARGLSLRANGNFVSDAQYKVDYEEERLVQLDKILTSYLSVSKSWDFGGATFLVQERRDLETDSLARLLPQVTYSLNPVRILAGYFSYSGSFTNSSMSPEYKQRAQNNFSLSFPFKLLRYLSVSPATNHTFIYSHPDTLKYPEYLLSPQTSQYSLSLSTNIYGRSIFPPEFRHTMRPSISYSLAYSNYAADTARSLSFSLGNDFQLMFAEKPINLATVNLRSSWDFNRDSLNTVSIYMYSKPFRLVDGQAYWTYRPYVDTLKFDRLIVNSYFARKDFSLTMSYSWIPREYWSDKSLRLSLNMKLTQNWKLGLSGMYDFLTDELIDQRFTLHRDLHCWEAIFNFNRYAETWRYDFKLQLKAIPEIKIGRTLFGLFL